MKQMFLLSSTIVIILITGSCNSPIRYSRTIFQTIDNFHHFYNSHQYDQMYDLLSPSLTATLSLEQFKKNEELTSQEFGVFLGRRVTRLGMLQDVEGEPCKIVNASCESQFRNSRAIELFTFAVFSENGRPLIRTLSIRPLGKDLPKSGEESKVKNRIS